MMKHLRFDDPEAYRIVAAEKERIENTIDLIAAENHAPLSILEAQGSAFNLKAAEGYPGRRFHAGCGRADDLESGAFDIGVLENFADALDIDHAVAEGDGREAAAVHGAAFFDPLLAEVLPMHVVDLVLEHAGHFHGIGAPKPGIAGIQVHAQRVRVAEAIKAAQRRPAS